MHHLEGNAILAGCRAKCCAMSFQLIRISIVTMQRIWHKLATNCLHFGKFPPQICESCVAPYLRNYKTFSAL